MTDHTPPDDSQSNTSSGTTPRGDELRGASGVTVASVARTVFHRLRATPGLAVPFVVAGVVVGLADAIRRRDPLPVARPESLAESLSIQPAIVPSGTATTTRHVDVLVDLQPVYLVGALAVEVTVGLAVVVAGWYTLVRALGTDADRSRGSGLRYGGLATLVVVVPTLVDTPQIDIPGLFPGVLAVVVGGLVVVRVFLVPGFVLTGDDVVTAVRRSVRTAAGHGWSILGLAVLLGTASWAVAKVAGPIGGGLSTAAVGPFHAVTVAVLIESLSESASDGSDS